MQIADGLKTLHDGEIIHRDLKGSNIFITEDGLYKIGLISFNF
jgi:serine/threonine protein kinase